MGEMKPDRKPQVILGVNVWSAARLQGDISWAKFSLRKCIRPLVGDFSPGHDDDSRVPFLLNRSVTKNHFLPQGFQHAVRLFVLFFP